MSGSGSAYYGLFDSEEAARKCADLLRNKAENVFVCRTKTKGVE